MNEEQIKQNAETAYPGFEDLQTVYIEGAHSRDKEIKELKQKLHEEKDFGDFKDTQINSLKDQLRNPWISVEKQLPSPEDVVFFRLHKGRPYVGSYFTKDKLFMSIEGCYFVEGVTHWMPIPEFKEE